MSWEKILTIIGCPLGLLYILKIILSHRRKQNLKGKVVLITGANSGLGKGMLMFVILEENLCLKLLYMWDEICIFHNPHISGTLYFSTLCEIIYIIVVNILM